MAETIEEYAKNQGTWKTEVIRKLAEIVSKAVPEADAGVKWAQPVFWLEGPFCYIKAAKDHVSFGFWRGAKMQDPHNLLEGTGEKKRYIKIRSSEDILPDAFAEMARESAELNIRFGNPLRNRI